MGSLTFISIRSLQNFDIGGATERMPEAVIRAFGIVKKAAAAVNVTYDLNVASSEAIQQAADEVSDERYD